MAVITLRDPTSIYNSQNRLFREGVELEKGVVITEEFLERNEKFLEEELQLYTVYPDIYLDIIKPIDSQFDLFPYQRLFLRALMRYNQIYITATRAASKSFLSVLGLYLQCVFIPNHRCSIVAPVKTQGVKIMRQKVEEIIKIWPLLEKELEVYMGKPHMNFSKDVAELYFKNGSKFTCEGATDSSRGLRLHSTFLDEVRDADGDIISEVILPQLNVSRRDANGLVNPYEVCNQQVIAGTSASMKSSYAYSLLIETMIQAIIDPKRAFVMGLDYRIPAQHGLVDKKHVEKLRMSSAYNEMTFASEFMGTWAGGSEESWFDFEKLSKYRTKKNPEFTQKFRNQQNCFYFISVDVGRLQDSTIACIFRVNIKNDKYYSTLVNIEVLGRQAETKTFTQQAIDLKLLIERYNPREVLIDCNGLGLGLADEMIKTHTDARGRELPAYGFFNNDDYKKIQPKDSIPILYSMKANGPLKSKINGNAYSRLNGGLVRFLISEQEARNALLGTKIGQKMTMRERVQRLLPHEQTTKLFEEMGNLRVKNVGMDIVLEAINKRFHDDRYYAFAYGLWRIKEIEEAQMKKQRKRGAGKRNLIFFTGGA